MTSPTVHHDHRRRHHRHRLRHRGLRLLPALLLSMMLAVAVAMELTVLRPALAASEHSLLQLWLARTPIVVLLALPWLLPSRER